MISVNGVKVELNHFPDRTLNLGFNIVELYKSGRVPSNYFLIDWKFENNEELVALIFIVNHIKYRGGKDAKIDLYMPYIPNARQDRCKSSRDIFTLKYFAELINSLNFDKVIVLDPHSSVSEGLINNIWVQSLNELKKSVLNEIKEDVIIYFPDNGAAKKYEDLFTNYETVYGVKHRDWKTGKIQGLEVITNGIDLKDKTILMFDDIVSYGGSLYYSALKLKELGVNKIYAYVTHTENSILDREKGTLIKLLEDGTVERLFTTNSLFTGEHNKITVL